MASRGTSSGGGARAAQPRARTRPRERAPPPAAPPRPRPSLLDTRLRPLAERPHLSAALLIGLFVLIYLWPALLGGKMLSPISVLYGLAPWQHEVPPDIHSYYNPLLSDVATAVYPWRWFARGLLHSGTLPAWDPHVFAGTPFLSNPQVGLFSPFSLPLWILNIVAGIVYVLTMPFVALATGYVYFDMRVREELEDRTQPAVLPPEAELGYG